MGEREESERARESQGKSEQIERSLTGNWTMEGHLEWDIWGNWWGFSVNQRVWMGREAATYSGVRFDVERVVFAANGGWAWGNW